MAVSLLTLGQAYQEPMGVYTLYTEADIINTLKGLIPERSDYRHIEGNSNAHIKASLVGSSVLLAIEDGRPVLGTWQGGLFCEFDGPRKRKVFFKCVNSETSQS